MLNYLKKHKTSLGVPTVVDDLVFSTAFHSSIDQPILTSNHLGAANNRAPDQLPYVSFFTEVYVYRNRSEISLKHFTQLLDILQKVHCSHDCCC